MNKGLEVVEARWLFDMEPDQIEVVIHPESIVHSMVRYKDGTVIAQLGIPDMQIPIAYALSCPYRLKMDLPPLRLTERGSLNFLEVETERYPALGLAFEALGGGGTMPAVLNAANEVAVQAFLDNRIGFREIHELIARTMGAHSASHAKDLAEILEVDRWARAQAAACVKMSLKEKTRC